MQQGTHAFSISQILFLLCDDLFLKIDCITILPQSRCNSPNTRLLHAVVRFGMLLGMQCKIISVSQKHVFAVEHPLFVVVCVSSEWWMIHHSLVLTNSGLLTVTHHSCHPWKALSWEAHPHQTK